MNKLYSSLIIIFSSLVICALIGLVLGFFFLSHSACPVNALTGEVSACASNPLDVGETMAIFGAIIGFVLGLIISLLRLIFKK